MNGTDGTGRVRRQLRRVVMGVAAVALFLVGAGNASASTGEQTLTMPWGTATVSAERYFIGGAELSASITDTKKDSRCVYVDYKINAPKWYDGFDKLTRVCGDGDSDANTKTWVGPSWTSAQSVEFRICREQGFGADPCSSAITVEL